MNRAPRLAALALGLAGLVVAAATPAPSAQSSAGQTIYLSGRARLGSAARGDSRGGLAAHGCAAACITAIDAAASAQEGRQLIPPVTGRFLFHPRAGRAEQLDLPLFRAARADREPYTDATLARAIRDGIDSEGKLLSYLMPRFALADTDMASLIAYLKGLDPTRVPGVSATELHFATIITPDADPVKRRGMLDVLEQFFVDRNSTQPGATPQLLPSGKTTYSKMMFKVNRHWELHVWELSGPESTWREQLEHKLAAQPVFAVISGLAGRTWEPVHDFCEREALPCLFPNVDLPPADAERDFHSLYFSRGVLLEADLIGKALLESRMNGAVKRVRQIYRAGDVGEAAAQALAALLQPQGVDVSSRVLNHGANGIVDPDRGLSADDALVFMAASRDLAALPAGRRCRSYICPDS